MMKGINQLMKKRLTVICDQFIEEQIGENKLNLMPPIGKLPIIKRVEYDKSKDTFEIYFNECNEYVCKAKNGIDFLEDQSGHLMAIRVRRFSQLNIDNIKLDVLTSIENEIKQVSMELVKKQDILQNVIDKRKLMFLDTLVKDDYQVLKMGVVG